MSKNITLQLGEAAPLFEAPNQDGQTIELRSFYGKNLVLLFINADNSSGAVMETKDIRNHIDNLHQMNYNVVAVSKDPVEVNKQFHHDMELPFDILADHDHNIMRKYGAWVEKKPRDEKYFDVHAITYLIDPAGVITHILNPANDKYPFKQVEEALKG